MAVTRARILGSVRRALGDGDGRLVVELLLDGQEVLEGGPRRRVSVVDGASIECGNFRWQRWTSPLLRLDFTTVIGFDADEDKKDNWDPGRMVAAGFETLDQQEAYMAALQNATRNDGCSFEGLESVLLEVDGEWVMEEAITDLDGEGLVKKAEPIAVSVGTENANDTRESGSAFVYALIAAAGVGAVLMLLLCGMYYKQWTRRDKEGKSTTLQELPAAAVVESNDIESVDTSSFALEEGEEDAEDYTSSCAPEVEDDEEEQRGGVFNTISMVVPPGKLGLVISNPQREVPIVLQMKTGSPLHGKVRVGDLLLSVDGVDCRGMAASEVLELVGGHRSQEPSRTLIVLREQ